MQYHDQWLQQQCNRPHAEQSLQYHQADQCERQLEWLLRILAVPDRESSQYQDEHPKRAGEIAMHHLLDGLRILERAMREGLVDCVSIARSFLYREMAIAARPIRTAQASGTEPDPCTENDDAEGE